VPPGMSVFTGGIDKKSDSTGREGLLYEYIIPVCVYLLMNN